MRRGDIVTVALPGDYGKPRPALVVQDEAFAGHPSLTLLLLTSTLYEAPLLRIPVEPDSDNGLERRSHICIDKAITVPHARLGPRIGRLQEATMQTVNTALARFLGLTI